MKTYFNGYGINHDEKWHTIQYFNGRGIQEIYVLEYLGTIQWLDNPVHGVIEKLMDYKTAKRRVASYEKQATRRIG